MALESMLTATRLRVWLSRRDVVFVVGLYKTGTSLAVELCMVNGFRDPSRQTNAAERGYGREFTRYLTHECAVLRGLNERWIARRDILGTVTPAGNYLLSWGRRIVLKDPRFVFTLPGWIEAARQIGCNPGVIFPERPLNDLLKAWEVAPFTRGLLAKGQLRAYMRGREDQLAWCWRKRVPCVRMTLEELRRLGKI